MSRKAGQQQRGTSTNAADLRQVFVVRVHQLVRLGHERLTPSKFAATDEPSLTQALVESMDSVLEDPPHAADAWCDSFQVSDDPPENTGGRTGKRRKRVDIRICTTHRPRQHFRFEAKRLRDKGSVGEYVGAEGLKCFLNGDYADRDENAGMLGYVQSGDEATWSDRLSERFINDSKKLRVTRNGQWCPSALVAGIAHTYHTRHTRVRGKEISIFHTLLRFN